MKMSDDFKHSSGLTKCQDENSEENFDFLSKMHYIDRNKSTCDNRRHILRKNKKEYRFIKVSDRLTKNYNNLMNIDLYHSIILALSTIAFIVALTDCISVKPIDFERYILPCYTGVRTSSSYANINQAQYNAQHAPPLPYSGGGLTNSLTNVQPQQQLQQPQSQYGQPSLGGYGSQQQQQQQQQPQSQQRVSYGQTGGSSYSGSGSLMGSGSSDFSSGGLILGQRIPRGQTIENFIELVSKIESSNPRLSTNLDQFIRVLLNRFHYDNYYYDIKSREMSSSNDKDIRTDINEQLLNNPSGQQQIVSDTFAEQALNDDEKCSMYFMLSHHIEKEYLPLGVTLKGITRPLSDNQQYGLLPVVRNSPGSPYPVPQVAAATGAAPRYPGPPQGFGSAAANGPSYQVGPPSYSGNNPFGMNSQFPSSNPSQFNSNYARPNSGGSAQGGIYPSPQNNQAQIQAQQNRQKVAYEFGVVSVGDHDNSNVVISRVLLGILAASQPSQQIRQLAASVFPNFDISGTTKRVDEEIDPLFAVTLADLWAISADRKKPMAQIVLGDEGHWNSTMCPTSFRLERADSIKFTTAELNGGLDGLNLGRAVRDIMNLRRSIKLSDLLRMYYSKSGFRPQFPDIGVCQRSSAINSRQEELKIQAENYLRLYDLKSPEPDSAVVASIVQLEAFRDIARRAATSNIPRSICENSMEILSPQDQCEISKADVVAIMDVSPQANEPFMEQCIVKVSDKINMWKHGSTMTILTNQMDSSGYGGSYSFNKILKNSSNPALIGCALLYDGSRTYQGGQINEPVRLVEMFEQTFVEMDGDKNLQRQQVSYGQSSYSSYIPTPFSSNVQQMNGNMVNGLRNTGASKSIIWFNYGSISQPQVSSFGNSYNNQEGSSSYRFKEAKRILGENFRGAAILAVGPNYEEISPFVLEQRDVYSQVPLLSTSESYADSLASGQSEGVSGPAEQLADQLVKRICEAPATFEYPNCRLLSDNTISTGYITPGRKQYWMMNARTFFASDSIRMLFKVEGGRIRVCFGRDPKPDETAMVNGPIGPSALASTQTATTNNYYTGRNYGICKDAAPGHEIEFIVDDPCYRETIATCKPFYYVINELSQGGESDPNWICRDEGCKRLDQVKFTLIHTGILCSSAFRTTVSNPCLVFGSIIYALWFYYKNFGSITRA